MVPSAREAQGNGSAGTMQRDPPLGTLRLSNASLSPRARRVVSLLGEQWRILGWAAYFADAGVAY